MKEGVSPFYFEEMVKKSGEMALFSSEIQKLSGGKCGYFLVFFFWSSFFIFGCREENKDGNPNLGCNYL